ncbi:succinate dehydrogenase, hydrophobic membrane anchor protein [Amorphus orientalis]|uniref:Succinate dehydrogenase hydrophobic membrane anchor subunit n=1 Tax=Amorphus orientalis TaxID=649198 RepID=A0AAE4ASK1_9HYPH|nr:succinate dehydrogenase, hydrophobic membrane anchor protein [Amorphus orientalis]MDQ0315207.1 succinate dehydrogenase / fumarate reductase membrane anchor subunit [Amorphus orientalis]
MVDMTTPLKRVRGLGSARSGTDHFWKQRLTALANVPLVIFFIVLFISMAGENYETVLDRLSSPVVAIVFILMIASVAYHMRLGMQVIIEDYIHGEPQRVLLLIANTFFSLIVAAASIFAILKISFGG